MSRGWQGGSTRAWRALRAAVLADNQVTNAGRCTLALRGCTGQAEAVHHVLGRAVTGDDPRYLAAVCAWCNGSAGEPGRNRVAHTSVSRW